MIDEKATGLSARIKRTAIEVAANSTSHAIPNIARTNNRCLQLIWLVCFLIATAACLYLNVKAILNYLDFNTITNIRIDNEIPMRFPAVTICNLDAYETESGFEFAEEKKKKYLKFHEEDKQTDFKYFSYDLEDMKYSVIFLAIDPSLNDSYRKSFSLSAEQKILNCRFNLNGCNISTNFRWFFNSIYGSCFSIRNLGVSTKAGSINGLSLMIYMPPVNNFLSTHKGVRIFIHNESMTTNGFSVPVGQETEIAMRKSVSNRQPLPYSDCISDLDSYDSFFTRFFSQNNLTYTQKDCFDYCFQRKVVEICKCYDLAFSLLTYNQPPCMNTTQNKCVVSFYSKFFSNEYKENCTKDCPENCNRISYNVFTSSSNFPTLNNKDYYLNYSLFKWIREYVNESANGDLNEKQKQQMELSLLKSSIVSLKIYFEDLSVTLIEESPKTELVDLVASLGGNLGLFIGISFLSLVEFVELFIQMCILCAEHKYAKRKIDAQKT